MVYVCLKLLLTHLRSWRLLICPRNVWVMFLLYGSSIESTQNSSDPLRYAFKWHAYKGYFITRTSPELRPSCSYKSPAIRNCPEFASLWYRRVRCHWAAIPSVSDAASSRSMSDASRQVLIADTNNPTGPMKFPEMAGSQASFCHELWIRGLAYRYLTAQAMPGLASTASSSLDPHFLQTYAGDLALEM